MVTFFNAAFCSEGQRFDNAPWSDLPIRPFFLVDVSNGRDFSVFGSERSLLLRALLEQRDRQTRALLNVNHENFFLVAKKNRADAARRSYAADLHFDNGLTHTAGLFTRLPAKIRIAFNG